MSCLWVFIHLEKKMGEELGEYKILFKKMQNEQIKPKELNNNELRIWVSIYYFFI